MKQPTVTYFGEHALLLEWKPAIDEHTLSEVLKIKHHLANTCKDEIVEMVSAFSSIAVYVNKNVALQQFAETIKKELKKGSKATSITRRKVQIPVCYDVKYATDLEEVAEKNKLSVAEVIKLHMKNPYKVYFLGFLPGFPYLGGLDAQIHTPRKETPREKIEAGSVAIGGSQTGIYTTDSPGGWNIIGKSPLAFFSIKKDSPALLQAGDIIQFKQISKDEYRKIEVEVAADVYEIEEEVIYD